MTSWAQFIAESGGEMTDKESEELELRGMADEFEEETHPRRQPRRPGRPTLIANRQEIRISVPSDLRERLRAESERAGVSDAEIVRAAIEAELARRGG